MRAIDAKMLEKLEMLYGDKNCLASLQDWFGTAEAYWIKLEQLFSIADHAEKHNPDAVEEISNYRKKLLNYFTKLRIMPVDGVPNARARKTQSFYRRL